MKDYLVRALSTDGTFRASAAVTTSLVEECRRRQQTDPLATIALGRLVTAASLCGSLIKDRQRWAMIVEGNGPLKKLFAETDARGHVRGSVKVPSTGFSPDWKRFRVSDAVGKAGFLQVIKDLGLKEPYRGLVQLQTSEIAEDLAYYFAVSEQTPSSVGLGVALNEQGTITAAGGFLVQALPGRHELLVDELENRLKALPPVSTLLLQGITPEGLLKSIFGDMPFRLHDATELVFRCACNKRQIRGILVSLGKEELKRLADEQDGASVTCEFCKKEYAFGKREVLHMAEKL